MYLKGAVPSTAEQMNAKKTDVCSFFPEFKLKRKERFGWQTDQKFFCSTD